MKFEREKFSTTSLSKTEEVLCGFLAIERVEETYFPALEDKKGIFWEKAKEHLDKAQELRSKFFPVTPDDFLPIEGAIFELALTERLLKNARYQEGSRLRVDVDSRDLGKLEKAKARSKDPIKVHHAQSFLDQAIEVADNCLDILSGEYAGQIGVDRKSEEFKGWVRSIKGLANIFSAALFQGAPKAELESIIDRKKGRIIQKREAVQAISKLGTIEA